MGSSIYQTPSGSVLSIIGLGISRRYSDSKSLSYEQIVVVELDSHFPVGEGREERVIGHDSWSGKLVRIIDSGDELGQRSI